MLKARKAAGLAALFTLTVVGVTLSLHQERPRNQQQQLPTAQNRAIDVIAIFKSEDPAKRRVIIKDLNDRISIYKIGDVVPGFGLIKDIGRTTLDLERHRDPVSATKSLNTQPSKSMDGPESRAESLFSAVNVIHRKAPGAIGSIMQFSELRSNGRLVALRISGEVAPDELRALGLRPGDLIVALNGNRVDTLASGDALFQSVNDAGGGTLTIARHGNEHDLVLKAQKILRRH